MLINQAKFRINGNTGYVLKPDFLRESVPNFDINDKTKKDWPERLKNPTLITIEVRV